jgi:hypothetical protein
MEDTAILSQLTVYTYAKARRSEAVLSVAKPRVPYRVQAATYLHHMKSLPLTQTPPQNTQGMHINTTCKKKCPLDFSPHVLARDSAGLKIAVG